MTVKEIVRQYLEEYNYDGLYWTTCCCRVDDLMPCDEPDPHCNAGNKIPCPGPDECSAGDCDFHIGKRGQND
jgi:hypothetical protein